MVTAFYKKKHRKNSKRFDFLSQEVKIKNLKKLVIKVCLLTFFEIGYIPLLIFKWSMRECATVEKLTRESLEPPPYHHRQPDRAGRLQRTRKRKAILFYRWGASLLLFSFLLESQTGGRDTPPHGGRSSPWALLKYLAALFSRMWTMKCYYWKYHICKHWICTPTNSLVRGHP